MPFKRSFTTQSHAYIRVTVTVTICIGTFDNVYDIIVPVRVLKE